MMPSSVAMFFIMDQLSLLRPAEDNRAMGEHMASVHHVSAQNLVILRGWRHGEGSQPSEAAISPKCPNPQAPAAAITAQLLRPGGLEGHRAELEPSG